MAASDHRADAVPTGRRLPADARPPAAAARRPADRLDRPADPGHHRRARRRPDRDGARPGQRPREADLDVMGPVHRRRPRHGRPGHGDPRAGTYTAADPMGLFWSLQPPTGHDPRTTDFDWSTKDPPPITLAAETNGGRRASRRLARLQAANGVQRRPLREHRLVGALYTTTARHPVLPCWCWAAPRRPAREHGGAARLPRPGGPGLLPRSWPATPTHRHPLPGMSVLSSPIR
jgi:Acyl-CoA thioester hydrolase/BAAT N-terminal region